MKFILAIIILVTLFSCETKYNIIDTGLANGDHHCSMYEYFKGDPSNWDSTRLMIDRAGLRDLFEGDHPDYDSITFFGPTNMPIRRWMIVQNYKKISDIPVEICKQEILRHVVKGIYLRDDIARGVKGSGSEIGTGGQILTGGIGNEFWIYSFRETYYNVPDAGTVNLYILSLSDSRMKIDVASTNIRTYTGIVHSLSDYYTFGTL